MDGCLCVKLSRGLEGLKHGKCFSHCFFPSAATSQQVAEGDVEDTEKSFPNSKYQRMSADTPKRNRKGSKLHEPLA